MRLRITSFAAVVPLALFAAGPAAAPAAAQVPAPTGGHRAERAAGTTYPGLLVPSGESGAGLFGASVAISSSGGVIVVGAPRDSEGRGAVWVFGRTGASSWRQLERLRGRGERGAGGFGSSVAVSADGSTILVGAPSDGSSGAAYVFVRPGRSWLQQGPKLLPTGERPSASFDSIPATGGDFGAAVALSASGDQALIGAPFDRCEACGAVFSFVRAASVWAQQGTKFAPAAPVAPAGAVAGVGVAASYGSGFGSSIALSADGTIALVGDPAAPPAAHGEAAGGAWIFQNSGAGWLQAAGPFSAAGNLGGWGSTVGLSSAGTVATVGDRVGIGIEYTRQPSGWGGQGAVLPSGLGFGTAVTALAGDGQVFLIAGAGASLPAELLVARGTRWTLVPRAVAVPSTGTVQSAALSADGTVAVLGSPTANGFAGAVAVDSFNPSALESRRGARAAR